MRNTCAVVGKQTTPLLTEAPNGRQVLVEMANNGISGVDSAGSLAAVRRKSDDRLGGGDGNPRVGCLKHHV